VLIGIDEYLNVILMHESELRVLRFKP